MHEIYYDYGDNVFKSSMKENNKVNQNLRWGRSSIFHGMVLKEEKRHGTNDYVGPPGTEEGNFGVSHIPHAYFAENYTQNTTLSLKFFWNCQGASNDRNLSEDITFYRIYQNHEHVFFFLFGNLIYCR